MAKIYKSNTNKAKVLLEVDREDLEVIKKASNYDMRSQRNFIVNSAIKQAKEILKENNEV